MTTKTKRKVGQVDAAERDTIQALYERKNSLAELFQIIDPSKNAALYEKVLADMSETNTTFHAWWKEHANKYRWENSADGNWEIDFDTCEIFLRE
ncbi:MAG: CXXX repeat peptide modification system protein [Planctomycetaceae bacterium]|jgi:CXXX repeat modification system protein|nr:CXXX repeat peptide modification system protein [Planctomycetaceae bacterium]